MTRKSGQARGLRIYLFGPPRVECSGRLLHLQRRQVRAFLYFLAGSTDPIPRERLSGTFWADQPEAQARRHLTHLLTHLQRALPPGDWFTSVGDTVSLSSEGIWVDVRAFARSLTPRLLQHAESDLDHVEPENETCLLQAAALFRGEFLSGFSLPRCPEFDIWACRERERWRLAYMRTLAQLIKLYQERGHTSRALEYAERYLALDDLAEDMHRRKMQLHLSAGNRTAALRQYKICVAALERELGVTPLPETQAVYQSALHGIAPTLMQPQAALPSIPLLRTRLVGRTDAFARLQSAWSDVFQGRGRVVLLKGEAGIGKTRLVSDFAASQVSPVGGRAKRSKTLAGGGQAGESKTPYFPLVTALRGSLTPTEWRSLSLRMNDLWLGECAQVLPEIRMYRRDLPKLPAAESRYSRTQLFEALTRLVLAISPTLFLFLDDMQWADGTTCAWLGTLARRIEQERILLVIAYRSDAINPDLDRLCESVGRMDIAETITLNRLSLQEVTDLIRQLAGQQEGAVLFSRRLHTETDGNPFFLLETLRTLFDQSVVRRGDHGWETDWDEVTRDYRELLLPETVRALLASRLRALSPTARQIAEVAAVIGLAFDQELVWNASGRSEQEIADAFDELMARQIVNRSQPLAPLPGALPRYAFTHDKLQEETYYELSSLRRQILHRRVGQALATLDPNAVSALAHHFEQAQDWNRAARFALKAGQSAREVFAHIEARMHFERALILLGLAEKSLRRRKDYETNKRMRIEALDGRGWVLRLVGEMDLYAADLDQVARLAKELGDGRLQARAYWRQAYAALWFCRYDQVARAGEKGISLSRAIDDIETETECVWTMALAARATGDFSGARKGLNRALTFFSKRENPVATVHLLSNLSTLNLLEKRHQDAEHTAQQALALCDQEHLPNHRRLPLGDLGALAVERGDPEHAHTYLMESLTISRQIMDRTQEVFCLGHLARSNLQLNNAAKARGYFTEALQIAQSVGSRAEQSWLYAGLGEMYYLAGEVEQAREAAQRALQIAEELGQIPDQEAARELLARL